jgi:hypothetical protein
MVDSNALIYYEMLLKTIPKAAYHITSTMFGLSVRPIEFYVQNDYEYLVISDQIRKSRSNEFS